MFSSNLPAFVSIKYFSDRKLLRSIDFRVCFFHFQNEEEIINLPLVSSLEISVLLNKGTYFCGYIFSRMGRILVLFYSFREIFDAIWTVFCEAPEEVLFRGDL